MRPTTAVHQRGACEDRFLHNSVPMTHLVERVRQVSEQPDGGAVVVSFPESDPLALFQASVRAAPQLGFVPVLASQSTACDLGPELLQRHVLIICADEVGVRAAIRWVRSLAMVSPRRHVVVRFGPLPGEPGPAGPADGLSVRADSPLGDRMCPRLARAQRWLRRGRSRAAERWLVAAAHAARRRGDAQLAALVERHVISRLLEVDRVAEAAARTRGLLRMPAGWVAYAEAAALWTAVLISRQSFAEARAWLISLLVEAQLRGAAVPTSVRTRAAELAFWQGRSSPVPPVAFDHMSLDELGWSALAAWSYGNLLRLTMLTSRLAAMRGPDDVGSDLWFLLCRLFTASAADREDVDRRINAVLAAVRTCGASGRFRRLALAVCGRVLIGLGNDARAKALLAGARGPGPEATVMQGRLAQGQAPGIRFLISGSANMHVIDGLSGLLAVIEDSEDDVAVLTGGCKWVRGQAGATAVAVVSADGATLVAAEGWRRSDLTGEIREILSGPARDSRQADHDRTAPAFGVSVRYGGVTVGFVVARGSSADRPAVQEAAHALAALCGSSLRARLDALTLSQRAHTAVPEIVGDSPLIAAVREAVTRAAPAPFPVLIEGESGTGKELVARALHRLGPRRDHRLSAVNCAALNDELVEAELFGHTRGAFTGAVGPRTGLFEEAHGGTVFLDEVTELSPRAQAKLLRVLQEGEVRRVGENVPRAIDVRVVAACNVPLADAVSSGRFRDDLRFRLAVVRIRLPALRERLEDVPSLARLFWRRAAADAGARATLGADALVRLTRHAWPGNVRELQNVVAGLVVAAPPRGRVTSRHVDQVLSHAGPAAESPGMPLEIARRTFERRVIAAALVRHAGRRAAAASELGLTRQGLTKALRRLGLAADEDAVGVA